MTPASRRQPTNALAPILLIVAAYSAVVVSYAAPPDLPPDATALAHASNAAISGLEFARVSLMADPAWQQDGHHDSPLVQLSSDGPYRIAFVVHVRRLHGQPARYEVISDGYVGDFGLDLGTEARGAGGPATVLFPLRNTIAVARARGMAVVEPASLLGLPSVTFERPPALVEQSVVPARRVWHDQRTPGHLERVP